MKVGTERQFGWLKVIIGLVFLLNAADAVFTVYWVVGGDSWETNPLMELLLGIHPVIFVSVKLLLVALGSWLLWRYRRQRVAVIGLFCLFIVYYWLLIIHLHGFNLLVRPILFGPG